MAKADVLIRESEGWHLIEVKSGVNNRPELLDDRAMLLIMHVEGMFLFEFQILCHTNLLFLIGNIFPTHIYSRIIE
jgi:hypothetical protein